MHLGSLFRTIILPVIVIALSACGGSDDTSAPQSPPLQSQLLTFAQVGPTNLLVGDVLTNLASGQGSGEVTYSSNNTSVATVSNVGAIAIVGSGDAIITANKAADDKYTAATASFTIHARGLVQTLAFIKAEPASLHVGDTLKNSALGEGTGAITYSTDKSEVATVDGTGLVTVTGSGTAIITANKASDRRYLAATASYTINSSRLAQTFSFAQLGAVTLSVDQAFTNVAVGSGTGVVAYSSSNNTIATVSNTGAVTVIASGDVIITATKAADIKYLAATASYTINAVRKSQIFSFNQSSPVSVTVGDSFSNSAIGQGVGVVTYASSNTAVATVNNLGGVIVVGAGTSTITASIGADGRYLASETSYNITASRASQTLSFAQAGPIKLLLGENLTNPATGQGTGVVTYDSSNSDIATVDASGILTIKGVGKSTITANKTADTKYLSATANYSVWVGAKITAWIGSQDTLVNFPAETNGFELYRSGDSNCDLSNYMSCNFGQVNVLNNAVVTDTAVTLNRAGYYVLKKGNIQSSLSIASTNTNEALLQNRYGSKVVSFNNKLYLIGGRKGSTYFNDVWQSDDGTQWAQITPSAAFSPRMKPLVLVKDNQLWLIGGEVDLTSGGSPYLNDVWSSTDGITWLKQSQQAASSGLTGASASTFKSYLAISGGIEFGGNFTDQLWLSVNGILWWHQGITCCAWGYRADHQTVVYNNQLWLIGGRTIDNFVGSYKNDVWVSDDAINWSLKTANAGFPADRMNSAIAYGGKLWWFGGTDYSGVVQVWSSVDGVVWSKEANDAGPTVGSMSEAIIHKGKLLLVSTNDKVEVWSSEDAIVWRKGVGGTFQFSE